jgi:hypothetical protein
VCFSWHALGFFLAKSGFQGYLRPAMTRASIELSIKIFLVALIATFVWTVAQVLGMIS